MSFNSTHTLSLTVGGSTSGQLDASAAGVNLPSSLTALNVKVDFDPDTIFDGQTFTIVKGKSSFSSALSANKIVLDFTKDTPVSFQASALGNNLVLTASRKRSPESDTVPVASNDRGDLALVPYYTVRDDWVTGLHIVNTSERTQVVKVRFRRATDAMDALDFNLVLSPKDVYAGFLSRAANGAIAWTSPDATCTAPAAQDKRLEMPAIYRAGAETGYVEIIAMGRPFDERQPIALAAKHARSTSASTATSTPLDCDAVRSNFFADGKGTGTTTSKKGVQDDTTTWQAASPAAAIKAGGRNIYFDSGNVLKVSYFIRDNATGIEFGDNAVHLRDFLANPAISNQQYGVFSGDLNGFDFPDLNGGVPLRSDPADADAIERGRFDKLRAGDALGVEAILNEWSANPANGVEMDWVVTLPGQYVMLNLPRYFRSLAADKAWVPTVSNGAALPSTAGGCPRDANTGAAPACDFRDQPVQLSFTAYNREGSSGAGGVSPELVVSPAPPGTTVRTFLPKVANVITFGGNSVLGQSDATVSANPGQPYGWVRVSVKSRDTDVRVCDWDLAEDNARGAKARTAGARFPSAAAGNALTLRCNSVTNKEGVPVIGFAAWSRNVAANPDASYGRIVEHSYRVKP